jgi:hypothetical protein
MFPAIWSRNERDMNFTHRSKKKDPERGDDCRVIIRGKQFGSHH